MSEASSRDAVEAERERILRGLDSLPLHRIYVEGDGRWAHLRADVRDLVARRPTTETLDEMERRALDKGIDNELKLGMFRLPRRWR